MYLQIKSRPLFKAFSGIAVLSNTIIILGYHLIFSVLRSATKVFSLACIGHPVGLDTESQLASSRAWQDLYTLLLHGLPSDGFYLGERQAEAYLPRGRFRRMSIS